MMICNRKFIQKVSFCSYTNELSTKMTRRAMGYQQLYTWHVTYLPRHTQYKDILGTKEEKVYCAFSISFSQISSVKKIGKPNREKISLIMYAKCKNLN